MPVAFLVAEEQSVSCQKTRHPIGKSYRRSGSCMSSCRMNLFARGFPEFMIEMPEPSI